MKNLKFPCPTKRQAVSLAPHSRSGRGQAIASQTQSGTEVAPVTVLSSHNIGGNSFCNSCTEKGSFSTTCRLPPCPSSSNNFKYSSASYLLKSLVEPHLPLDQIGFRPLGVSWLTRTIDWPVIWLTVQLTDQDNWLMFVCLLFIWHISPGTI